MKKQLIKLVIGFILLQSLPVNAQQQPPFWNEVQAFKKSDSIQLPPPKAILFTGSSSFRLWDGIEKSFPLHTIINRGFGGSSLPDVIRYANDLIFPYDPKQIVIYCGENDIAASDSVSSKMVLQRFQQLFSLIRHRMPAVPILFVSIKPSPSRWHMKDRMIAANKSIKKFLRKHKQTQFVDVWSAMLDGQGKPMENIFKEDRLHMNAKGYAIWQEKLEPYLIPGEKRLER